MTHKKAKKNFIDALRSASKPSMQCKTCKENTRSPAILRGPPRRSSTGVGKDCWPTHSSLTLPKWYLATLILYSVYFFRSCTDIICCILFVLYIVGMVALGIFGKSFLHSFTFLSFSRLVMFFLSLMSLQGHPATVFFKISVWRSTCYLEFSIR